jgi:hypothetical protein
MAEGLGLSWYGNLEPLGTLEWKLCRGWSGEVLWCCTEAARATGRKDRQLEWPTGLASWMLWDRRQRESVPVLTGRTLSVDGVSTLC